mgnify:CR=1 FL=1
MKTNRIIKSRFKIGFLLWFLWMSLATFGLIVMLKKLIERFDINGLTTTVLLGLFVGFLIFTVLMIFKDFKYIRIDTEQKTMTWYSPVIPWGKKIFLTDYKAKIKTKEIGSAGGYSSAYLLDETLTTRIKVNGLFYKNFGQLFNSLELTEIRHYEFNIWKYFKLIYTGRIKIKPINNKN